MTNYFKQMCEMVGYSPKTTFWMDFSIAEVYGNKAIYDTYHRAFDEWKTNTEYVTELVLVLNWKIWYWYGLWEKEKDEKKRERYYDLSTIYDQLWKVTDEWCLDHLKGADADYYFRTTD